MPRGIRLRTQRRNPFAAIPFLLLSAALLTAACAGDDADDTAGQTGAPISCRALEELDSYRYNVAVQMGAPGPTPSRTAAAETTESAAPIDSGTPAPLTAFADALAQLFTDFSLQGAYQAPDRSQAILNFRGDDLELRVIGDDAWVRVGDAWQTDEAREDEVLTPVVVCEQVVQAVRPSLRLADPEEVRLNGVTTRHYDLDPAKAEEVPPVLGQELAGTYTVDAWIATDGHWPVQFVIQSQDPAIDAAAFRLSMTVRDVNDPGIRIVAP
ncbi:MAG: hypothetical protein WD904_01125 [Dehalococcoidia bacterium]